MTQLKDLLPVPVNSPLGGQRVPLDWLSWFNQLYNAVRNAVMKYTEMDFTGSNLTSIQTRNHNDLQNIQGGAAGDNQHLTTVQVKRINSNRVLTWLSM